MEPAPLSPLNPLDQTMFAVPPPARMLHTLVALREPPGCSGNVRHTVQVMCVTQFKFAIVGAGNPSKACNVGPVRGICSIEHPLPVLA